MGASNRLHLTFRGRPLSHSKTLRESKIEIGNVVHCIVEQQEVSIAKPGIVGTCLKLVRGGMKCLRTNVDRNGAEPLSYIDGLYFSRTPHVSLVRYLQILIEETRLNTA